MSIICVDIPNTEEIKKALHTNAQSLVRVHCVDEKKIPGINATKLAPCILPGLYKKFASQIDSFRVYEDDVWVTSFPKCGAKWIQEMVWLIVNDLNYDGAKRLSLAERYGFLELSGILPGLDWVSDKNTIELAQELPRPRFIKSHHPIALLPNDFWTVKPKLVYVVRNPKDVAISYYHSYVNLHGYTGSLEDFLESFLNDLVLWSPFKDHVLDYWKLGHELNILIIEYEEMFTNLPNVLQRVIKFFNKSVSRDQFIQLVNYLSFNEMKNNRVADFEDMIESQKTLNNDTYRNRGLVNSFKYEMPMKYQQRFDQMVKESDFKFKFYE